MGPKIKAGCGILKILDAGYGMKLSWRDLDSLLFVGGMWDIENFSGGIRDEIVSAGPGFVTICRREVGYFEFEGGMRHLVQNVEQTSTIPDRIWDWLKNSRRNNDTVSGHVTENNRSYGIIERRNQNTGLEEVQELNLFMSCAPFTDEVFQATL